MGGGGFLYHMKKSLEGNRALLKKRGHFNNANDHAISRAKTIPKYKKATDRQLQYYKALVSQERSRQTTKMILIGIFVFFLFSALLLFIFFSNPG